MLNGNLDASEPQEANSNKDIQAGMDVARLKMDYFEPNEMVKVIEQIQAASDELGTSCPIFIDLKGMLVRTLVKNKPIKLAPGKTVYIGDDPSMAGKHDNLISSSLTVVNSQSNSEEAIKSHSITLSRAGGKIIRFMSAFRRLTSTAVKTVRNQ